MTQFTLVCDKSTLQMGQMPISNTNLFHPLLCWVYERFTYWTELQLNCQINLSSFPLPSDIYIFFFLLEMGVFKSLIWCTAVICRDNTHTQLAPLHIQPWPFPKAGRKNTVELQRFKEAAVAIFLPIFPLCHRKNSWDRGSDWPNERMQEYSGFLLLPLHLVQIKLGIIFSTCALYWS